MVYTEPLCDILVRTMKPSKGEVRSVMSTMGSRGGKANTAAQQKARQKNLAIARAAHEKPPPLIKRPSPTYLAWLAGFWEGEGSILVSGGCLRVTIAQKEKQVLQEIADRLDGKIYFQVKSNSHRVYWYGARARRVLVMIIPHLRSQYRRTQIVRWCPELENLFTDRS